MKWKWEKLFQVKVKIIKFSLWIKTFTQNEEKCQYKQILRKLGVDFFGIKNIFSILELNIDDNVKTVAIIQNSYKILIKGWTCLIT